MSVLDGVSYERKNGKTKIDGLKSDCKEGLESRDSRMVETKGEKVFSKRGKCSGLR